MKKKMLKNIEWSMIVSVVILIIIGLVALFSATKNIEYDEFKKQLIWLAISIPIMMVVVSIDYDIIAKFSFLGYGALIIALVLVFFTTPINGATSWFNMGFFLFQPAEFMKIFTVLFMAKTIVSIQEKYGRQSINNPLKLGLILLVAIVPIVLILKQPDYGTAGAFLVSTIMVLFTANIKKRYIIISILIAAILLPTLYLFVLPEHAKNRIDVFLNPELDPKGAGYNAIQSKLAIGAGKFFGMGLLKGNQTQLGFLYPKTTDFIYAVICEEMGFAVGVTVVVLYIVFITKGIYVAKTARDTLGSYIAIGITGIFLFHVLENIGMTIGLLPITGIPLPFISYGGSSLITNFILFGLLINVSARRKKVMFMD